MNVWCRLCACENKNVVSIFTEEKLVENIHRYLQIQILEEDCLSDYICETCRNQIKELIKFITHCQEAQRKLYKLMFSIKTKVLSEDEKSADVDTEIKLDPSLDIPMDLIEMKAEIDLEKIQDSSLNVPIEFSSDDLKENDHFTIMFTLTISELPSNCNGKPNSSILINTNSRQLSVLLGNGKFDLKELGKRLYQKYLHGVLEKNHLELSYEELLQMESEICPNQPMKEVTDNQINNAVLSKENAASQSSYGYQLKTPSILLQPLKLTNDKHLEQINNKDITTYDGEDTTKRYECTLRNGSSIFICSCCSFEAPHKYRLNQHFKEVHEKRFKCDKCDKCFGKKSKLRAHENTVHIDLSPMTCDLCNESFTQRYDYKKHIKTHSNGDLWVCDVCKEEFCHMHQLYKHLSTVHKKKSLKCPECPKVTSHKYLLTQHIREVHQKPVICDICNKHFSKKSRLAEHIKNKHMEKKVYECESCTTKYSSKKWFLQHKNKPCAGKIYVRE